MADARGGLALLSNLLVYMYVHRHLEASLAAFAVFCVEAASAFPLLHARLLLLVAFPGVGWGPYICSQDLACRLPKAAKGSFHLLTHLLLLHLTYNHALTVA